MEMVQVFMRNTLVDDVNGLINGKPVVMAW